MDGDFAHCIGLGIRIWNWNWNWNWGWCSMDGVLEGDLTIDGPISIYCIVFYGVLLCCTMLCCAVLCLICRCTMKQISLRASLTLFLSI